jgi:hypothetical protein
MKTRLLGIYLCILSVAQCALYIFQAFIKHPFCDYLFYFNPRLGLGLLDDIIKPGSIDNNTSSWISAIVLFIVGVVLVRRPLLNLYIIAESIMAIPSIIFFLFVFAVNMKATDGFSRSELLIPVVVFVLFSGPPFLWALQLKASKNAKGGVQLQMQHK